MPERLERAIRLRSYFDLQLRFAEAIANLSDMAIETVVARHTNFHRRFGFGRIGMVAESPEWRSYTETLGALATHDDRVDWTQSFFARARPDAPPEDQPRFGCFACEPPNAEGTIRIHFGNHDAEDGTGPLSSSKVAKRSAELKQMLQHVAQHHPTATQIRGGSWLYNLEAYRRLFPPAYVRSAAPPPANPRFDGTSSWGQFLDHRENVRPDLRAAFLRNLDALDLDALWRAFPMPPLMARAPLAVFHRFYGTEPDATTSEQTDEIRDRGSTR